MHRNRVGVVARILTAAFIAAIVAWLKPSAAGPETETVTTYRDTYGVPHIYSESAEAGFYAVGYAQAEDRLEELLKNYLRATGEMAQQRHVRGRPAESGEPDSGPLASHRGQRMGVACHRLGPLGQP